MMTPEARAALPWDPYLGPARVISVPDSDSVSVSVSDSDSDAVSVAVDGPGRTVELQAHIAMFAPFRPRVGDQVVLMTDADRAYLVGVLTPRPGLELSARSTTVRAIAGTLGLESAQAITLRGPRLRVLATETLTRTAEHTLETCREATRTVRGLWSVEAGDRDEHITRSLLSRARRATHRVREAFLINGEAVRAG